MRRVLLGLAAGAATLALSSAAQAAAYLATYTGIVSDGSYAETALGNGGGDFVAFTHAFGAVNGSFDGAAFTLKFRYDTSVGNDAVFNWTDNLTGNAPNSPVSWVAMTINGQTGGFKNPDYSTFTAFNGAIVGFPDSRGFAHQAGSYSDPLNQNYAGAALYNISVNKGVNQTFSGPTTGGDTQYSIGTFAFSHCPGLAVTDVCSYAGGNLAVRYLDIQAIPEPATWALMLIGFGGLGAVLRRRRAAALAAA